MNRTPVDSSNIHSIGHDATGLEVQYHATNCDRRRSKGDGHTPGQCGCKGGDVWHHPEVPAELHQQVMSATSVGSAFSKLVKGAKHPTTGALLYPAVKIAPKAASA